MAVKVVGTSATKVDALEKALGASRYTNDLSLPRMLVGRMLGSSHAHALIRGINTARAEKVPGIKAVVTESDAPRIKGGYFLNDLPIMARDRARYVGEPLAAVAAVDEDAALEALELIEVEYEPLPAVFDVAEALQEGAPLVHPDWASYGGFPGMIRHGNVCSRLHVARGDVDAAFRAADLVLEETYRTQRVHQAYLEPSAVLVEYAPSGRFTVWASNKAIFDLQSQIATLLQLPLSSVRCIAPPLGGAFGGKHMVTAEAICALLARKARRPVKLTMSRHEEFTVAHPRLGSQVTIKSGVTAEGRILGRSVRLLYDVGAYAGTGPAITATGVNCASGPYRIDHLLVDGLCVYTNKMQAGPFRGFGAPQVHFACESHLDALAQKLGIDPLELRLKNAVDEGWRVAGGEQVKSGAVSVCLQRAAEQIGWGHTSAANRGVGIAAIWKGSGMLTSSATVRLLLDGSFALEIGAVDVGQGSNTALSQIAAQALGVPLGKVRIGQPDTQSSPYDWATAASRLTSTAGRAVERAAIDAREKLLAMVAPLLEAAPADLEVANESVRVKSAPGRAMALTAIGGMTHFGTGVILGYGSASVHVERQPQGTVEGFLGSEHQDFGFGAVACEVEVDPYTGQVRPLRVVAASDLGAAINPQLVEAQMEGAVMQGIGYALSEEQVTDDGVVCNTLLNDYLVPTVENAPRVESIIVEGYDTSGPFGARGVGEHPLLGVAPAIANAVRAATSVQVRELPLSPERVLKALREQQAPAKITGRE